MKKIFFVLPFAALAACGGEDSETQAEPVKLSSFEDSVSYSIGTFEGSQINNSQDPNASRLDKHMILEGFKDGYKPGFDQGANNPCVETINKLFGVNGMDFDTTYLEEGCKCIGNFTGGMLYQQFEQIKEVDNMNKDLVIRGFEDGLFGKDSVIAEDAKMALLERFNVRVGATMQAEQQKQLQEIEGKEAGDWEKIKAIPGIIELEGGVCVETLKKGSGPSPKELDDVEASYILSDFTGTVIQDSKDVTPEGKFQANLHQGQGGVIQGWITGFQAMQKGGKYKLYIPAGMAYGEKSLVFEIELFDFGPQGSIVVPQQQPGY